MRGERCLIELGTEGRRIRQIATMLDRPGTSTSIPAMNVPVFGSNCATLDSIPKNLRNMQRSALSSAGRHHDWPGPSGRHQQILRRYSQLPNRGKGPRPRKQDADRGRGGPCLDDRTGSPLPDADSISTRRTRGDRALASARVSPWAGGASVRARTPVPSIAAFTGGALFCAHQVRHEMVAHRLTHCRHVETRRQCIACERVFARGRIDRLGCRRVHDPCRECDRESVR